MKNKIFSIFLTLCLTFAVIFTLPVPFASAEGYTIPPDKVIEAKTAMLMNVETGQVLYEKNPDEKVYPASITKLLTALVVFDKVTDLKAKVTAYGNVITDLAGQDASNSDIQPGEILTVEQLLYCLIVPSACDASNVLAMYTAGSIPEFVKWMNEKAKSLQMDHSNFVNAHGLHSPDQYTTPNDLMKLAKEVIKNEKLVEMCDTARYSIAATNNHDERILATTNYMIDPNTDWFYQKARGLKTGNTDEAGRCLLSYATDGDVSYICLVTGCSNENDHVRPDFDGTATLLDWAFSDFTYSCLVKKDDIRDKVDVSLCREKDFVSVAAASDFYAVVPYEARDSVILEAILDNKKVEAPVKKDTVMGHLVISCGGIELGRVDLIAVEDLDRSTIMFIESRIGSFLTHPAFITVLSLVIVLFAVLISLNIHKNRKRRRYFREKAKRKSQQNEEE